MASVPRPAWWVTCCVLGTLAGAPAAVLGQTQQPPPSEPPRFGTEVVVTPERGEALRAVVAAATGVIGEEELPALPAVQLGEVLSFVPGFHAQRFSFHAGRPLVSARGFFGGGEADYVRLLVDGVAAADVESGLNDWSLVATSSIRRIELLRGPGASMYGDSAVGGVVQILTDRPASGGQLTAGGGSFGSFTADGAYSHRWPATGVAVAAVARRTSGGFDHAGAHQMVIAPSGDGRAGPFAWRWTANADMHERDDPGVLSEAEWTRDPYASNPLFRFDMFDRHAGSTALTLRHTTASWRPQARIFASVREEDAIRTILLAPSFADRQARALSTGAVGGSLDGERTIGAARPGVVRFGGDVAREHLDTSYYEVSALGVPGDRLAATSGGRIRSAAFLSGAWEATERMRVSGAVRWDYVDDHEFSSADAAPSQHAWSPRLGVVVRLDDEGAVSLFSQVSRAFKAPSLDQRFDPRPYPDFQGGSFTISNSDLVPQRAWNVEAGVTGAGRLRWSALAYHMAVDDEIDFDVRTFRYANIGESRHVGLELEAEGRWWAQVQPFGSYALSRVVEVGGDRQLKNVPRHRVSIGARAELPLAFSVFGRYDRSWGGFLDDENAYPIQGPSAVDVRVRRPVGRHAVFLDVLNLTDDVYAEYGFTLQDFRGRVVPHLYSGAPRAIRAGVSLTF